MSLQPIKLDPNFFSKIQNRKGLLKAIDLDFQFNGIVNYFNNEVIPLLNQLLSTAIPGVVGSANYYLKNIGDGNTEWSPITVQDLVLGGIFQLNILEKTNVGSILATGADRILKPVTAMANDYYQSLTSVVNDSPIWKDVIGEYVLKDRSIDSTKLGRFPLEKFKSDAIDFLKDTKVTTNKIADNTIASNAIRAGAINGQVLGEELTKQFTDATIWPNTLPSEAITFEMIAQLRNLFVQKIIPNSKIPASNYAKKTIVNGLVQKSAFKIKEHLDKNCIDSWQIKDNSIDGIRLIESYSNQGYYGQQVRWCRNISDLIEPGAIGIDCFPPDYKQKLGL